MPSDDEFEWHHAKARSNYAKHGVTFDTAKRAFADPFAVEVLDDRGWAFGSLSAAAMISASLIGRIFRIPIGTLRDWEQGASEPDQAARAYLTVIARNPEAVIKALTRAA